MIATDAQPLLSVVYEDQDLLVVNKPAGLVCHPTKTDEYSSLIGRARLYLGHHSRPHLVNRLDRETSGATVICRSPAVARELGKIWENRQVEKEYLAIVHGRVHDGEGMIEAPLGKDQASRVAIKDCVRSDGVPAQTEYRVKAWFMRPGRGIDSAPGPEFTVLQVRPRTGRKHQIRIHLAHIGHPIVGDKLYGGDEDSYLALVENRLSDEQRERLILPFHALHASEVRFSWRGLERFWRAEPEPWFKSFQG